MPDDELPPVSSEIMAQIDKLAEDLPSLPDSRDASKRLEWLIEALIWRGQLPDRYREMFKKIEADRSTPRPVVRLAVVPDKYAVEGPVDLDCAALIPICGARCCSFTVGLSKQDVIEGKLPWVLERPYELPRDPQTKRCICAGENGACTVYEHRPGLCRQYDCRNDKRIWTDFENRISAPIMHTMLPDPIPDEMPLIVHPPKKPDPE